MSKRNIKISLLSFVCIGLRNIWKNTVLPVILLQNVFCDKLLLEVASRMNGLRILNTCCLMTKKASWYSSFLQEFVSADASRKTVQRIRALELPPLPENMQDLVIPQCLRTTIADVPAPFLLFDNARAGRRLIIFSSGECLRQLGTSTSW